MRCQGSASACTASTRALSYAGVGVRGSTRSRASRRVTWSIWSWPRFGRRALAKKGRPRLRRRALSHRPGGYGSGSPYGANNRVHPKPGKAAYGKRLHRVEIDPTATPVVQRNLRRVHRWQALLAIAKAIRDRIPSPSVHVPARNRHRDTRSWSKLALRSILMNPRYVGKEVWNKQRHDEVLLD